MLPAAADGFSAMCLLTAQTEKNPSQKLVRVLFVTSFHVKKQHHLLNHFVPHLSSSLAMSLPQPLTAFCCLVAHSKDDTSNVTQVSILTSMHILPSARAVPYASFPGPSHASQNLSPCRLYRNRLLSCYLFAPSVEGTNNVTKISTLAS